MSEKYDHLNLGQLRMAEAKERLLREQLKDAEDLIDILANCEDDYYIAEHRAYNAKWNGEK